MTEPADPIKVLPIACTLTPTELKSRQADLLAGLVRAAEQSEARPDGYRFRFAPSSETLTRIAAVIDAERQCCRFLCFQLTIAPDLGSFRLDVTGPEGTAEFLADLLQR
jgi:hypothetical protein